MIDMAIQAGLLTILLGILYAIYLVPPVKRLVRSFFRRHSSGIIVSIFAVFVAAVMYFHCSAQDVKKRVKVPEPRAKEPLYVL